MFALRGDSLGLKKADIKAKQIFLTLSCWGELLNPDSSLRVVCCTECMACGANPFKECETCDTPIPPNNLRCKSIFILMNFIIRCDFENWLKIQG